MFARIRIAFGNLRGKFDQAAVFKFADRGGGGFGKLDQFGQRQFASFFDNVPNLLLALGQFWKFAAHRQCTNKQSLAPAGFLLAHGFWQDGFQGDFRRAAVIIRNPASELQNLWRDESRTAGRTSDPQNGFEVGNRGFFCKGSDIAKNFSRTEWHLHAAAHFDLPRKSRRNQIIKLLAQRNFEADTGNHGTNRRKWRAVPFQAACVILRVRHQLLHAELE